MYPSISTMDLHGQPACHGVLLLHVTPLPALPAVGSCGIKVYLDVSSTPCRAFNDRRYYIGSSKLAELGWKERTPWEEGLKKTIEW